MNQTKSILNELNNLSAEPEKDIHSEYETYLKSFVMPYTSGNAEPCMNLPYWIQNLKTEVYSAKRCDSNIRELFHRFGFGVRYDEITREIEVSIPVLGTMKGESGRETLTAKLFDLCTHLFAVDFRSIERVVSELTKANSYNSVIDYFKQCEALYPNANGVFDRLMQSVRFVGDQQFYEKLFRKALIQAVAMVHNGYDHGLYGNEFVFILQSPKQGIGKTQLFVKLFSGVKDAFGEGRNIDPSDKDSLDQATVYWAVELGEIESTTTKKSVEKLKAFITACMVVFRTAYERASKKHPMRTAFFGTANSSDILVDTENRRFVVAPVESINLNEIDQIDKEALWAELYSMWKQNKQGFRFTSEERETLSRMNSSFRKESAEEIFLKDTFDFDSPPDMWDQWFTASELVQMADTKQNRRVDLKRVKNALERIKPDLFCDCSQRVHPTYGRFFSSHGRKYRLPKPFDTVDTFGIQ